MYVVYIYIIGLLSNKLLGVQPMPFPRHFSPRSSHVSALRPTPHLRCPGPVFGIYRGSLTASGAFGPRILDYPRAKRPNSGHPCLETVPSLGGGPFASAGRWWTGKFLNAE